MHSSRSSMLHPATTPALPTCHPTSCRPFAACTRLSLRPSTRFSPISQDDSGFLSFDELQNVVRRRLRIGKHKMSDETLKSLWVAIDAE